MRRIMVTGYITIEDHEHDPGDLGPLTEQAWLEAMQTPISVLDDVDFTDVTEEAGR